MKLLDELKSQGYSVKVSHGRSFTLPTQPLFFGTRREHPAIPPNPAGGFTIATIRDAEGVVVAQGTAHCSRRDNYNKSLGLQIALSRANFKLTRPEEVARREKRRQDLEYARIGLEVQSKQGKGLSS